MDEFKLEVHAIPASTNQLWLTARNGRRYLTGSAKHFKDTVIYAYRYAEKKFKCDELSEYELEIFFYKKWRSKTGSLMRRDVSNYIKCAEDGLCEAIGIDDSRIVTVKATKIHSDKEKTFFILRTTYGLEIAPLREANKQ